MSKTATIYDLAQATGLSKTTISDALRGNGRVAPETRQMILDTARSIGYEANYYAQRLKGGSSNVIGLVTLALDTHTLMHRILLMQHLLNEEGFDVPIHGAGLSAARKPVDQAAMINTLRRQKPRGVICHTYGLSLDAVQELRRYQDSGGNIVCFGTQPVGLECDQVQFDAAEAVYSATKHLLELGHRRIGLLPTGTVPPDHLWYRGWERALSEFGVAPCAEWVMDKFPSPSIKMIPDGSELSAEVRAKEFINWEKTHSTPRPTALCIINDHVASAFVSILLRAGLSVPGDVSIVSYDDMPIARYCIVPLSAVKYPVEEIANEVVQLMCSRIDGSYSGAPRQVCVHGDLTIRQSTAAISRQLQSS
jgi:DNA-binding LacI/PurR family transcriptional regulator